MNKTKKDVYKYILMFSSLYPRYSIGTLIYSIMAASKMKHSDLYQMSNEDLVGCIKKAISNEHDEVFKTETEFSSWVNDK